MFILAPFYPLYDDDTLALAGADASDIRIDPLALVAACAFSKDKKAALKRVSPILDRGIGLNRNRDGPEKSYVVTSNRIRQFLEGNISKTDFEATGLQYYLYPN